jgi:hypothetical protein
METPEKNPTLQVSSLQEFKKYRKKLAEGVVIELPESKLKVRVTRPSLEDLVLKNKVPKELIAVSVKKAAGNVSVDDLKQVIELRNYVVTMAIIEPKFVEKNPKEDELTIDVLSQKDKDFIFNYVEKGDEVLTLFRRK